MDAIASLLTGRPGRTHPDRPAVAGGLALLLLMTACSTVTPPADPVPVAPPAVEQQPAVEAETAAAAKPAGRTPRRAMWTPTARPTAGSSTRRLPADAVSRDANRDINRDINRDASRDQDDDDDDDDADDLLPLAGPAPRLEPLHAGANRPYRLNGREYRPLTALKPFRQRGIASWYGTAFHGRRTATGERYDMHAMTAAHPTLPLPSYARVRNLKTGASVIVRVNDRGPFADDRVIDLSRAAARHLDMLESGVASVEVQLIVPEGGVEAVADARR